MAGRKEYTAAFILNAQLGGKFSSTFKSAKQQTQELQNVMKEISRTQSNISGYQKTEAALNINRKKAKEYADEVKRLKTEIEAAENPTKKQSQELERAEKGYQKTTEAVARNEEKLKSLKTALDQAGVDTKNLEQHNRYLKASYEEVKTKQKEFIDQSKKLEDANEKIGNARGDLLKSTAVYKGAIEPAVEFETAFAKVIQAVDASPQEYDDLRESIREMSKELPMTAVEIAGIADAAGRLGIQVTDIKDFTRTMIDLNAATGLDPFQSAIELAQFASTTNMAHDQISNYASTLAELTAWKTPGG